MDKIKMFLWALWNRDFKNVWKDLIDAVIFIWDWIVTIFVLILVAIVFVVGIVLAVMAKIVDIIRNSFNWIKTKTNEK